MMKWKWAACLLVCWGMLLATTAQAQTEVTLTPVKDNTLYESATGSVSNGSGNHLFAGVTGQGTTQRALLAFDVAGSIPADATIESVSLALTMSKTNTGAELVAIHRLLADWGEGTSNSNTSPGQGDAATSNDATWVHRFFDTETWNSEGGDFVAVASATLSIEGMTRYTWTSAQLAADVQGWLDQPAENFGWILLGNESGNQTSKRFDSREGASGPTLLVSYSVPTSVEEESVSVSVQLSGNYPNPFTESTVINYTLQTPGHVQLEVYDLLGRHVTTLVESNQGAGPHSATFRSGNFPNGLYIYRLTAAGFRQHRLMTLQR